MDYVVSIAGSIFMEDKKNSNLSEKLLWFSNLKLPFFMIGSNIGPVYTENYIKLIKEKILCKAKDVCLRDIKSYDLVADCKNVRYAADVVFNLDVSKYTSISSRRKVIISVINIDMKAKQIVSPNKEKYQRVIIELIKYFKNKNYEVELFSFCENEEKDEEAIDEIISLIENKNEKVSKYFYNGNIDDAITELASGKIIIGSRFHANVLAMLLKKNIIPIIYNDKTREMLKDINFQGKFIDIEKIDEFNISDLSEDVLNYKHDITREIENAELQFEALDKELERK